MKKILVLSVLLLLVASVAMADPVNPVNLVGYDPNNDGKLTYDELVGLGSSGGILDDKLFFNFAYSGSSSGGTIAIPAAGITVGLITTPFNPGFQFNAAWSVGPRNTMDSLIQFDVQVLPGGNPITDIYAKIGGYGWTEDGLVTVAENTPVGNIFLIACNGGVINEETIVFDPTTGVIHVIKDIALNGNGGFASVSQVIDQFSETPVPEPATMLLLGSGLVGLAGYARKRFKK